MRRLLVDFNNRDEESRVWVPASQETPGIPFKEGEEVLLSDGEGSVRASLTHTVYGWAGVGDWSTWKEHSVESKAEPEKPPEKEETVEMNCVGCGALIPIKEVTCGECVKEEKQAPEPPKAVMLERDENGDVRSICKEELVKIKDVKTSCSECGKDLWVRMEVAKTARQISRVICNECENLRFVGTMFGTAQPSTEKQELMVETREEAKMLGLRFVERGGRNACTRIALRMLQEAVMYANRAVLELD